MKWLSKIGILLGGVLLFAVFFILGASLTETTPKLLLYATGINNWDYHPQEQTIVYYSDGQEMDRVGYKRVYSEDFPPFLKESVVAVEDRRFYQHAGLDSRGIGRAIWNNLKAGRKAEGGSTITQQLARTMFLSNQKSYSRKIKEVFIATAIEEKYGKEAILNMYLNEIYMGRGCSGMACAARSYFGKDIYQLNKAEMTMLVGIIQAPEYYSPDRNLEAVKKRQAIVTEVLVEQGLLTSGEAEAIKQQPLYIKPYQPNQTNHPYYMAYLTSKLENIVGTSQLYRGGLKVYTTLDRTMQKAAESAVKNQARSLTYRGITAHDMALVSIDPRTGGIRALVGGVDFSKNQNNMAILPRQPGSAIKPLYYAAAMDEGLIVPDTVINNKERSFNGYRPQNHTSAPAKVTIREALVHSYNVASVEVLNRLGPDTALKYLADFGITTIDPGDNNLALGLGGMTRGISPLQMANAFSMFATNGVRSDYYLIDKISDSTGNVVYTGSDRSRKVISRNSALLMDDILKDVVNYGTGTAARMELKSGGKTGTTEHSTDLWYVGYTGELATAVWAGNSDGKPVTGYSTYGGSVAAPVWRNYMSSLYYNNVFEEKPQPVIEETPTEIPQEQPEDSTLPGGEQPPGDQPPAEQPPGEQPPDGTPTPEPAPVPSPAPQPPLAPEVPPVMQTPPQP